MSQGLPLQARSGAGRLLTLQQSQSGSCIHALVRPAAVLSARAPRCKRSVISCAHNGSSDWLQGSCSNPCNHRHDSSASRRSKHSSSICKSLPTSHVGLTNNQHTAQDLVHLLDSQEHSQQVYQLLRQQQTVIAALQQEVQQLRSTVAAVGIGCAGAVQAQQPYVGSYKGMTIEDFRALPDKLIMVRHAESQGNVDARTYSNTPDYEVPLSARGWEQAVACGHEIRVLMEAEHGSNYKLFFMSSPYCRTRQTFVGVRQAFPDFNFAGVQEEVQLREQDFGNFQNPEKIKSDLAERNRFGRFYYRFPDGESGSDVYNRVSIFEDHLIRDMKAGRFSHNTSLCLVTHGLTMRVFLMRWFNWTVESFLQVYNPPNAKPIVVEKISEDEFVRKTSKLHERRQTLQVKNAYRLRKDSMARLKMGNDATQDMENGMLVAAGRG